MTEQAGARACGAIRCPGSTAHSLQTPAGWRSRLCCQHPAQLASPRFSCWGAHCMDRGTSDITGGAGQQLALPAGRAITLPKLGADA